MSRNVNVQPGLVYSDRSAPLELPLIQMSSADAEIQYGEPQIYDKDYPLDYDGLNLSPPYWSGTGAGDMLTGMGAVADPVFNDTYAGQTFWDAQSQKQRPVAMTVAVGLSNGPKKLAVWNYHSQKYDVALADKLMRTQHQRREYDNAMARRYNLPAPWPGYNYQSHDPCSLGGVGGGNVSLMPWEKGYGFSGLGLTPAQQKAAAARLAAQQKAAADKLARQQKQQQAQVKQQQDAQQSRAKNTKPQAGKTATNTKPKAPSAAQRVR